MAGNGGGSQARHSALGQEQVKCKENPVSKNIPMTLSNIQLLAVRGAGAGGAGGAAPWEVLAGTAETTEINRVGSGQGSHPLASAGPLPAHLPICPTPPAPRPTPNAAAPTPSTRPTLRGKDYNVGRARGGGVQSAGAGAGLSTRPGLLVGVPQSHRPRGVQSLPRWHRECQ